MEKIEMKILKEIFKSKYLIIKQNIGDLFMS